MPDLKKKILYLVTQAEWGGAQRYVFDLATNLTEEVDITVATGRPDKDHQELIERLEDYPPTGDHPKGDKIKRLTFKHLQRDINPYHDILAIFEIAKFLRQNHFDVIHLNSSKAGVIGALAAWINKKYSIFNIQYSTKIIYTAHGWVYLEPLSWLRRRIYLWMEKIAARLRDATIVLSEKEKEIAIKYGTAKRESIFVIPNGIDSSKMKFLGKEEAKNSLNSLNIKLGDEDILIGTIANLYKTKGLEYLIEAIKILNIKYLIFNIKVVIIGEGNERDYLESKIKKFNLEDNIFLVGSISDASKYLKAFDIFVLPSVKEGFPYTILEAMAAGLPIVATEVGAIPEIIENQKTGVLVPPADALALAEAIKNLIDNPEKTNNLALNAREKIRQFSLNKTIEETRKLYQ